MYQPHRGLTTMYDFLRFVLSGPDGDTRPCEHLAELRCIKEAPSRTVKQDWFHIESSLDWMSEKAAAMDAKGYEVYYGVLPRINSNGGTAKDVLDYAGILWADVDAKHHGDSKVLAFGAVADFPIPPSAIVDSGHGYHAYWKLDRSIHFDRARQIMKGIAREIGGDPVYDAARILRLPGLNNHKGGGLAPVRLVRFDTTRLYDPSDFYEYELTPANRDWLRGLSAEWDVTPIFGWTPRDPPAWLTEELDIDPGKGARSEHDFRIALYLAREGYPDEDIIRIFREHPNGVGVKAAKEGLRYLYRTLGKVREVASQ